MITLAEAVARLTAAPRPILFVDTRALLDVVRATLRGRSETVRAARELVELANAGTVQLFVQDIVQGEWDDNLAAVRKDGEDGVRAYMATWVIALDQGFLDRPVESLFPEILIDRLEDPSRNLLWAAETLDRDHHGMSWAIGNVVDKRKPAGKAGKVKDAHILGHALRLSSLLRRDYPRSRILVGSNTTDFSTSTKTGFNDQIAEEAARAGLGYANSLETAVEALRNTDQIF